MSLNGLCFDEMIPAMFESLQPQREEAALNWSRWVRQLHRWLSTVFTLVVIFNGVAVLKHRYTNWMGLLAVVALALMFFTGVYLFVLPYVTTWRSGRRAD